jgi:DNA-directed RNA polymerase subunit RPC12/RpoP
MPTISQIREYDEHRVVYEVQDGPRKGDLEIAMKVDSPCNGCQNPVGFGGMHVVEYTDKPVSGYVSEQIAHYHPDCHPPTVAKRQAEEAEHKAEHNRIRAEAEALQRKRDECSHEETEYITLFTCPDCGDLDPDNDEPIEGPLYECGSCGTRFTRDNSADGVSHRCPDCNKFGSKVGDGEVCPQCETEELDNRDVQRCVECELIIGANIDED